MGTFLNDRSGEAWIGTKEKMYRLLEAGRFGNYPRMWSSVQSILDSGFRGDISIRSKDIANPVRLYHIPVAELDSKVNQLVDSQKYSGLTFTEAPPDGYRVVQGEYDGYNFDYTFAPHPMRIAFEHQRLHANGAKARWLLKAYLDSNDLDWLDGLLEDFPGSVVEFSAFSVPVGVVKSSKTIFWEVRHY